MAFSNFIIENKNDLTRLMIKNPKTLNSLSTRLLKEFEDCLDYIIKNLNTRILIITGTEKAFVAGADIEEMSQMGYREALKFSKLGHRVFSKIEDIEIPVIASINGFALGGGLELALACDIRIASSRAKLGQPEVGLGIIPGFGATQRLARTIGIGAAKHLIYTGEIINADRAYELGLVSEVTEPEFLDKQVMKMANKILENSKNAISVAKKAINEGSDMPLKNALELEKILFAGCFNHNDQEEGMKAFIEKRDPDFE